MNRGIITISETGGVTIPPEPVWMTQFEIADLFYVFSYDVRKIIHSIYKTKELDEVKTMKYIRLSNGTSFDAYNIEMIIAIAFRIQSKGSNLFREFIIDTLSRNKSPIRLFISYNGTENSTGSQWGN